MLPQTGTAENIYGSLKLTGNDNSNSRRQVFYVNGAKLLAMNGVKPLEGIPSGATIVVNVSGTSSGLTNMSMAAFDDSVKQKVLFNFYEATELKIRGIGIKGSILAPYAHLENPENGHIDGTLIAASVGGNMQGGFLEQHPFAFTGDLPCVEPVLASLGDRVWYDANENGIQDDGEAGANGVTVTLYTSDVNCTSGDVVAETTTDDDGKYLFENLDEGEYYVEFSNLPTGYTFTTLNQGSDDASDSDADRTTGRTVCTSLKPGDNDLTWDAGLVMEPGISKYQKVAEPGAVIDPDSGWIQSPLYEIGMEDTLSYKIELEDFEYDGLLGLTIQDTLDENLDYSGGMFVQMLVGTEWKDLQMSDYQFQSDNDTLRWSSFSESVLETADSFRFLFNASVTSDDFDAIDNTAEFTLDGEEPFTDSNIVVAYPVPEPGTILFLSVGLFGLFAVGRRRLKK
jgi:hypothetical protein